MKHFIALLCGFVGFVVSERTNGQNGLDTKEHQLSTIYEGSFARARWHVLDETLGKNPGLFSGCTKVFLDVGSNRGTHIRKLFEPQKYPGCPYRRVFDQAFGPAANRSLPSSLTGICAFGFEANPRWAPTLGGIQQAYAQQGWRAHWFVPYAVSDSDRGNRIMWKNDPNGANSDWGFSTSSRKQVSSSSDDSVGKVSVPSLDFSEFIDEMHKKAPAGYRLMKMDIEASEFDVLPRLAQKQLLCEPVLNTITIEWHDRAAFFKSDQALNRARAIKEHVLSPRVCESGRSTAFEEFDDESFLDDGKPLPPVKTAVLELANGKIHRESIDFAATNRAAVSVLFGGANPNEAVASVVEETLHEM